MVEKLFRVTITTLGKDIIKYVTEENEQFAKMKALESYDGVYFRVEVKEVISRH